MIRHQNHFYPLGEIEVAIVVHRYRYLQNINGNHLPFAMVYQLGCWSWVLKQELVAWTHYTSHTLCNTAQHSMTLTPNRLPGVIYVATSHTSTMTSVQGISLELRRKDWYCVTTLPEELGWCCLHITPSIICNCDHNCLYLWVSPHSTHRVG